jgi:hypothetical protein
MKKVIKYLEDNNRYSTDHKSMNYGILLRFLEVPSIPGKPKEITTVTINRLNRSLDL